ncbi:phenylacetate--CoA ligase family protein [Xanthobacter dioxanivorans]|uniref:Phenylacetate--CoA ligase family protein n=1 Tax=Xanthobacter dioxanivorans TaxID=2528964 RepID=A0A974PRH6_9HYPH|nr:phenylacetate--CoA ligase family protein [Xanthobacter dioxanivorans]QRG08136.1 phenylacetate--CoA ligase family protein [Xanthobacter dioxanivorans]
MTDPNRHYDSSETRDREAREKALFTGLAAQIAHAKAKSAYFGALFKDVEPEAITSRQALAALPVTRKSDLLEIQPRSYPFGGLNATPPGKLARIFMSPGPIYDVEGHGADFWRFGRALFAAGFRAGDIVHNSFSYHLTPAGSMIEGGAHALGCAVVPGGVGQTDLQLRAIADIRPQGYGGTPSFLKILVDKARQTGTDISSLKKALVTGEAFLPPHRAELRAAGITARQCYGTADLGLVAYESEAEEGLIVDEGCLVEILRPGTGDPVESEGEVGEVVVTLFEADYPLVRFATGDLSAVLPGLSPCGRTNVRLRGWMGRADQVTKIRGMFVHPVQVTAAVKKHPAVAKARLVVDRAGDADDMLLEIEVQDAAALSQEGLLEDLRAATKLRGRLAVLAPGTLPADAKTIEDRRPV